MKYVLVDRNADNIMKTVELTSNIGISGAKTYFLGIENLPVKEFDQLWKVMTKKEYDLNQEGYQRKPSSHPRAIEWWKEETSNLDIERE